MKFVAIADTHGRHDSVIIPSGEVLIHAGDISMKGAENEVIDFLKWFSDQDFEYKILVAGNHDFYFEEESMATIQKIIPQDVIYLNDNSTVINGIKIWGSPITPSFHDWAFNRNRGSEIKKHWDLIPNDIDILITHGPVFRRLDTTFDKRHVGCKDLHHKIHEIKPKIHICGHIHEAHGTMEMGGIKYINASVLNERYDLTNAPIVFELSSL
jgi:Icc-related predicted phosphoesterase